MRGQTSSQEPLLSRGLVLGNRQRSVVDAFISLCASRGYREVTIDAVAATVRTSRDWVYDQFGSKEGMLLASLEQSAAQLLYRSEKACEGADSNGWDRLTASLSAILAWMSQEEGAAPIFLHEFNFAGPVAVRNRERTLATLTSALVEPAATEFRQARPCRCVLCRRCRLASRHPNPGRGRGAGTYRRTGTGAPNPSRAAPRVPVLEGKGRNVEQRCQSLEERRAQNRARPSPRTAWQSPPGSRSTRFAG